MTNMNPHEWLETKLLIAKLINRGKVKDAIDIAKASYLLSVGSRADFLSGIIFALEAKE